MTRRIEETNAHSKDVQKEYIAILGIFAAVVLAFTGGIAFTTSVLQNIHMVSYESVPFSFKPSPLLEVSMAVE